MPEAVVENYEALPFPLEEYQGRWARLRAEMRSRGIETAVIWQRSGGSYDRAGDVFWLSNYASLASGQEQSIPPNASGRAFAALLVHLDREPELHIAEPIEATDLSRVALSEVHGHDDLVTGLAYRLKELDISGAVSYVGDDTLPTLFSRILFKETPEIEWLPADDLMFPAQMVKSPLELDAFRKAGAISSMALTGMMEALINGERESTAAAIAAEIIVAAGGGFQRVCMNHGPASEKVIWSDGLHGYTSKRPQVGDLVRGWVYGPIKDGYWVDPGRSAVCGRTPSGRQRDLLETTVGIINETRSQVRAGVTPRSVAAITDQLIGESKYDDSEASIWTNYGHGVGTYFQPPVFPIMAGDHELSEVLMVDEPLKAGMVLTLELFLEDPGVGTSSFEEVFIVTDDGTEILTTTPQIFW